MNKIKLKDVFKKPDRKLPFSCRLPESTVNLIKETASEFDHSESRVVNDCVLYVLGMHYHQEEHRRLIENESTNRRNQKTSRPKRSKKTK